MSRKRRLRCKREESISAAGAWPFAALSRARTYCYVEIHQPRVARERITLAYSSFRVRVRVRRIWEIVRALSRDARADSRTYVPFASRSESYFSRFRGLRG